MQGRGGIRQLFLYLVKVKSRQGSKSRYVLKYEEIFYLKMFKSQIKQTKLAVLKITNHNNKIIK